MSNLRDFKHYAIIALILMMFGTSFAQTEAKKGFGKIKGIVYEKVNKEPIPMAIVKVYSDGKLIGQTQSNFDGEYLISPLNPGKYHIIAVAIGYDSIVHDTLLQADKELVFDIIMTPKTLLLKEEFIISEKRMFEADATITESRVVESIMAPASVASSFKKSEGMASAPQKIDPSAGVLTAGEINDFSKWELWKDLASSDLKKWQEMWKITPTERYSVQVMSQDNRPVIDCNVSLIDKQNKTIWSAKTDNTGKAELWANIFGKEENNKFYISVNYKNQIYTSNKLKKFTNGLNIIQIPALCQTPKTADIMFVVDATGSMGDEISYLKAEVNDIIVKTKKQYPQLGLRLGSVFYRDQGDEYVTRKSDFSDIINKTTDFINEQKAGGGGDYPEAVDQALDVAINQMQWSDSAVARIIFLVLDAPSHNKPENITNMQNMIKAAAKKGIKIIPITGSNMQKDCEYLMRCCALATNGKYVFLTDHSGVGDKHIKPSTDEYDVFILNTLIQQILNQYLYTTPCNTNPDIAKEEIKDTMIVKNPKLVAHEIVDSTLIGKFKNKTDTTKLSFVDTVKIKPGNNHKDSIKDNKNPSDTLKPQIEKFNSFKYYPNPTKGELYIEFDGESSEIYFADISGKLLERYKIKDKQKIEIDISKYPTGIYFLKYQLNKKWLMGKVVLIR